MKRRPLPAPLDSRAFSRREARALGVPLGRLRSLDLRTPHVGARARGLPAVTLLQRCREYAPILRPGQVFSHETAAELWGLPVPAPPGDGMRPLHVGATQGREPHRPGVTGHRLAEATVCILEQGLPVVSPVEAWAQCGAALDLDALIVMAEALMGRWSRHGEARLRPREELEAAIAARGSGRGVRPLRDALTHARPGVRSPQETRLRLMLVRAGAPEPEVNGVVCDGRGRFLGESDLVWRDARVVVEYEGDHHRTDREQWMKDIRRREDYDDAGWRTIRVTSSDLRRGMPADALVSSILTALRH